MEAEQNQRKLISVVLRSLTDLANIGFSVLEKKLAKHRDQRQEEVAQLRNELREKQSKDPAEDAASRWADFLFYII